MRRSLGGKGGGKGKGATGGSSSSSSPWTPAPPPQPNAGGNKRNKQKKQKVTDNRQQSGGGGQQARGDLQGMPSKNKDGSNLCFAYNRGKCDQGVAGRGCAKGLHACGFCGQQGCAWVRCPKRFQ